MYSILRSYPLARLKAIFTDKKTAKFSVVAALGAFFGSLIGYQFGGEGSPNLMGAIVVVSIWDALIGIGIGSAIAWVQSSYLRNTSSSRGRDTIRTGMRCALGGALGGIGLVLAKSLISGNSGHVAGWTLEGLIIAWMVAPVFPNMPRKPAAVAGLLAGFLGGLVGPSVDVMVGSATGIAVADSFKGLFLAAMLTWTERFQAISSGSLIVHWGLNEESTILLGPDPIKVGSAPGCHIYLKPDQAGVPVVAEFIQTNGKTILNDLKNHKTIELPDRTVVNIGTLRIEVRYGVSLVEPRKS